MSYSRAETRKKGLDEKELATMGSNGNMGKGDDKASKGLVIAKNQEDKSPPRWGVPGGGEALLHYLKERGLKQCLVMSTTPTDRDMFHRQLGHFRFDATLDNIAGSSNVSSSNSLVGSGNASMDGHKIQLSTGSLSQQIKAMASKWKIKPQQLLVVAPWRVHSQRVLIAGREVSSP